MVNSEWTYEPACFALSPFTIHHSRIWIRAVHPGRNPVAGHAVDVQRDGGRGALVGDAVDAGGGRVEAQRPRRAARGACKHRSVSCRDLAVVALREHTLVDADRAPAVVAVHRARLPMVPDDGEDRVA